VLPPPAQHVAVQQTAQLGTAQTVMSMSSPVPPTMTSNSPRPQPNFVITPAPLQSPASQYGPPIPPTTAAPYAPTMHSGIPTPPPAQAPMPSMPLAPYSPPPPYGAYPMMMQQPPMSMQPMSQQGTPGLAVAALVCGLLGWIPFWIGFILCILAIIFASITLSNTRSGQPGRGLAITGLVFGLVLLLPAACGL
jgi:hypothetical protein